MTGIAAAHSCGRILRLGYDELTEAATFNQWIETMLVENTNTLRKLYRQCTDIRTSPQTFSGHSSVLDGNRTMWTKPSPIGRSIAFRAHANERLAAPRR